MSSPRDRAPRLRSVALHLGVVVGASVAVSLDRRIQRRRAVEAPLAVGVVAAGWYAAIAGLERRHPHRTSWNEPRDGDVAADRAFVASTFAASLASEPFGTAMARRSRLDLGLRRLPAPVAVAISLLGYELAHTLMHRLGHEWGPAWTVHSVHHSPSRLYWLNATRFHLIESLVDGTIEATLLGVLGMSRDQRVAHLAVRALYGQLQHCNVELDSGPLDHLFSTPDLHRWHHSVDYDEGDTNFGAVISIWDQVLRSFLRPGEPFAGSTGVGRMPDFPSGYLELQRVPWEWAQVRERNADTWYAPSRGLH